MLCPGFGDSRAVVPNNDVLKATQTVSHKFYGGPLGVRVESIPDEFCNRLYVITGARHLLEVIMFGFESEYDHVDSGARVEDSTKKTRTRGVQGLHWFR
jgi:hypothetical protein